MPLMKFTGRHDSGKKGWQFGGGGGGGGGSFGPPPPPKKKKKKKKKNIPGFEPEIYD